ncbi:MAG: tripartite tricarboxylate transporter substrate binding protein [Pseudomonadota bacterium]
MKSLRCLVIVAVALLATAQSNLAGAKEPFPDRPIKIVVGTSPGGITDLGARKLAELASKELRGQPIVIENKPGAMGTVAVGQIARGTTDGYTVMAVSTSSVLIGPLTTKVGFDPLKDLAYLMNYAGPSQALLVRSDSKYQTLDQLIADAKANPGAIAYATYGVADAGGFGIKALSKAKGVSFNQIPYQGSSQQLVALLAGEVQFTVTSNYMTDIRNGRMRALALLDKQRYPGVPEVPTFKEKGIDFEFPWIMGLVTSAGVPADIRKKLEMAFVNAGKNPEFTKFMAQREVPAYILDADEMTREMRQYYASFSRAVKEYGLQQP